MMPTVAPVTAASAVTATPPAIVKSLAMAPANFSIFWPVSFKVSSTLRHCSARTSKPSETRYSFIVCGLGIPAHLVFLAGYRVHHLVHFNQIPNIHTVYVLVQPVPLRYGAQ